MTRPETLLQWMRKLGLLNAPPRQQTELQEKKEAATTQPTTAPRARPSRANRRSTHHVTPTRRAAQERASQRVSRNSEMWGAETFCLREGGGGPSLFFLLSDGLKRSWDGKREEVGKKQAAPLFINTSISFPAPPHHHCTLPCRCDSIFFLRAPQLQLQLLVSLTPSAPRPSARGSPMHTSSRLSR